ncbi:MAG: hypothetical protein UY50_C0005G0023 [Parcubacteria group bacterium GW2011_GWA2_49_9]|nr:MAG: hypothetical protein UY50_C0005G0023 [Parcubacteria group bacterium GW2011_GWA2_49_9]
MYNFLKDKEEWIIIYFRYEELAITLLIFALSFLSIFWTLQTNILGDRVSEIELGLVKGASYADRFIAKHDVLNIAVGVNRTIKPIFKELDFVRQAYQYALAVTGFIGSQADLDRLSEGEINSFEDYANKVDSVKVLEKYQKLYDDLYNQKFLLKLRQEKIFSKIQISQIVILLLSLRLGLLAIRKGEKTGCL